jgi:C-terminal processing protease CtpA/Prc
MNAETRKSDVATYYTINRMVPDGAAAMSGQVHVGDRVVSIAGQRVESLSVEEAKRLIQGWRASASAMFVFRHGV